MILCLVIYAGIKIYQICDNIYVNNILAFFIKVIEFNYNYFMYLI